MHRAPEKTLGFTAPPAELVREGRPLRGIFSGAVPSPNLIDVASPWGWPWPVPRFLRALRLKEWQSFEIGFPEGILIVVIYNAKSISLGQFSFYDRSRDRRYHYSVLGPAFAAKLPLGLFDSVASFRWGGLSLSMHNDATAGRYRIQAEAPERRGLPALTAELSLEAGRFPHPLVVSLPFEADAGMYSHKEMLGASGTITLGERRLHLAHEDSFAFLDDHKGFYPFTMRYDWVTAAGRDDAGRWTGFNLTANQVRDPERYNENVCWHGGALHRLPVVTFHRPDGPDGLWEITSPGREVNLTFRPLSPNRLRLRLVVVGTDYHGPFGELSGEVRLGGEVLAVRDFLGMGELKRLRG